MATNGRKTAASKTVAPARKKPGPKPKALVPVSDGAPQPNVDEQAAAFTAAPKPPNTFLYGLLEEVTITASKEEGIVRARGEWATGNVSYFVAYKSARGEFKQEWIDQDQLTGNSL